MKTASFAYGCEFCRHSQANTNGRLLCVRLRSYQYCDLERSLLASCGRDGQHFSPIPQPQSDEEEAAA